MPEDMARALGAKGGLTVTIAEKECTVRPLGLRELTEVERDCLQRYKRQYLETFSANVDLLPEEMGQRIVQDKMDEAARWDVDDLPPKYAHDPDSIRLTPKLKEWLNEHYPLDEKKKAKQKDKDLHLKRMTATAMDQETLSQEEYRKLAEGHEAIRMKVPYVNWWITASFEGMITFIWTCFRHNGVTRDQVVEALGRDTSLLVELSREIERLSVPAAGNG